jgi:Glycosyl hydrolase family 63 C-terminal domain
MSKIEEIKRLHDYQHKKSNWKHWGPYLSDRQWGTVREDYSENGTAWNFFPHDHSRSRAYRWGEDGIGGISDRNQFLCFAWSFWNGKDPILKERFFGVTSEEGNHGEDVKEYYFYLDSTPTHSYMKMLYKYPILAYPYEHLVSANRSRTKDQAEYELSETEILNNKKYFDCVIEYAKASENDILIKIQITNQSTEDAEIDVLPTIWYRNTWSWGYPHGPLKDTPRAPELKHVPSDTENWLINCSHPTLGEYYLYANNQKENLKSLLFTENETNAERLFGLPNHTKHVKDGFHRYIINNELHAVNPDLTGTKAAVHYHLHLKPKETKEIQLRLTNIKLKNAFKNFNTIFEERISDADEFYKKIQSKHLTEDESLVQRQAMAGLLWSKQLYYYDIEQWLEGDPAIPPPPASRKSGRNKEWIHLTNFDIISMPDKWEFPWYAAWDLAFHCIPLALVDTDFAKRQLELMTREWYMHPNGQLPAYEWAFGDVNPPVHAWATWRVYKIDAKIHDKKDTDFLEGIFHKLLLNFTWWVNRKDTEGKNIFQGGFLGLDNIGVFDRSSSLPTGGFIDQADGTSWMASYCLTMLQISLELAKTNKVYQDSASKFLEHFLRVANAMTDIGGTGTSLWHEQDGFFYDMLHLPSGEKIPLKVRSLVGILPLIAVDTIEPELLEEMPDFKRRLEWFVNNRPHLSNNMASLETPGKKHRRLAALLSRERLVKILSCVFDENEFLSPYGIRSISKFHQHCPFSIQADKERYTIGYEPGESKNSLFGGNSNWRGPVWFPINYLIIEALQKFNHYYGEDLKVEYPTYSGKYYTLGHIATDLSQRLSKIFLKDKEGKRPFWGENKLFADDSSFQNLILFNEYFHGDNATGLGASHQTGWTALVAKLLQQSPGQPGLLDD